MYCRASLRSQKNHLGQGQLQDDPLREDALMRAERLYDVLSQVNPVEDDSAIPLDSVLREFIGGSIYEY